MPVFEFFKSDRHDLSPKTDSKGAFIIFMTWGVGVEELQGVSIFGLKIKNLKLRRVMGWANTFPANLECYVPQPLIPEAVPGLSDWANTFSCQLRVLRYPPNIQKPCSQRKKKRNRIALLIWLFHPFILQHK